MKTNDNLIEFKRLFSKATGEDLTEDDARWHRERLVQLYRVLLRDTGESRFLQVVRDQLLRRLDFLNQFQKGGVSIHPPGSNIVDEPALSNTQSYSVRLGLKRLRC